MNYRARAKENAIRAFGERKTGTVIRARGRGLGSLTVKTEASLGATQVVCEGTRIDGMIPAGISVAIVGVTGTYAVASDAEVDSRNDEVTITLDNALEATAAVSAAVTIGANAQTTLDRHDQAIDAEEVRALALESVARSVSLSLGDSGLEILQGDSYQDDRGLYSIADVKIRNGKARLMLVGRAA